MIGVGRQDGAVAADAPVMEVDPAAVGGAMGDDAERVLERAFVASAEAGQLGLQAPEEVGPAQRWLLALARPLAALLVGSGQRARRRIWRVRRRRTASLGGSGLRWRGSEASRLARRVALATVPAEPPPWKGFLSQDVSSGRGWFAMGATRIIPGLAAVLLLLGCGHAAALPPHPSGQTPPSSSAANSRRPTPSASQSPSRVVALRMVSSRTGWAETSDGVVRTTDAGQNWKVVTPPGFSPVGGQHSAPAFLSPEIAFVLERTPSGDLALAPMAPEGGWGVETAP